VDKLKLISKIATYISAAGFIFAAISAISTYLLVSISYSGAPAEFFALNIVIAILPYLFVASLALIVSMFTRSDNSEEEAKEDQNLDEAAPSDEIEKVFEEGSA
jgi:flagellar basal body-associated protein FliL